MARRLTRLAAVAAMFVAAIAVAYPARAEFGELGPDSFGMLGCSNSSLVNDSVAAVGDTRGWQPHLDYGGGTITKWAQVAPTNRFPGAENIFWGRFDKAFQRDGADIILWPVCIKGSPSLASQQAQFLEVLYRLRLRTDAPLYLSPQVGSQPSCTKDNDVLQAQIVEWAVGEGYALRGPDIPAAATPLPDQCHFDAVASTNIGYAVSGWLGT